MSKIIKELLRKNYTTDFKRETVKLLMDNNYTLSVAAKRLGISKSTLSKWRHELLNGKGASLWPSGHYIMKELCRGTLRPVDYALM